MVERLRVHGFPLSRPRRTAWLYLFSAIALVSYFFLNSTIGATVLEPRIERSTVVMGLDISGLTKEEAAEAISTHLNWDSKRIRLLWDEGSHVYSLKDLGLYPDVVKTLDKAQVNPWWRYMRSSKEIELCINMDKQQFANAAKQLESSLNVAGKDAELVVTPDDGILVKPHVMGRRVQTQTLMDLLYNHGEWNTIPASIEIPIETITPTVTMESVKSWGIKKLISSYTTSYAEDGARSENIKLAAAALDGLLVPPGGMVSFNDIVGPRTGEKGYYEANVFWGNEIRKGTGGGVCQVSTTLYNTVLLANLEIVERTNHSLVVDYVPLGRDAAVSYGEIDFKFRNNSGKHVLIKAKAGDGKITIKAFGDMPSGMKVSVESTVVSRTEPKEEVVEDPAVEPGGRKVLAGKPGYFVKTERIIWLNGKIERREPLPSSSYLPLKTVVRVSPGVKSNP